MPPVVNSLRSRQAEYFRFRHTPPSKQHSFFPCQQTQSLTSLAAHIDHSNTTVARDCYIQPQKVTMSLNPRTPGATHTHTHSTSRLSTVPTSASKTRQLSHLHAQLAQLTANMSDMENLLRMTAVQAEGMRGLGGYAGGM